MIMLGDLQHPRSNLGGRAAWPSKCRLFTFYLFEYVKCIERCPIFYVHALVTEDSLDSDTTPYLDIANQTGRTIQIPPQAKKVSMNSTKVVFSSACASPSPCLIAKGVLFEKQIVKLYCG